MSSYQILYSEFAIIHASHQLEKVPKRNFSSLFAIFMKRKFLLTPCRSITSPCLKKLTSLFIFTSKKHHGYFFAHTIRSEGNEVKEIGLILPRRDFVYLMIDVNATFYCQLFLCQGYSQMTSYRSDVLDTDAFASSFELISNFVSNF